MPVNCQKVSVASAALTPVLEILTPCWAIGAAIGPLIGGLLAEPAETMPSLFGGSLWQTYPYLLSAMGTAMLPAASAVACWLWLPEVSVGPAQADRRHSAVQWPSPTISDQVLSPSDKR